MTVTGTLLSIDSECSFDGRLPRKDSLGRAMDEPRMDVPGKRIHDMMASEAEDDCTWHASMIRGLLYIAG